MSFILRHSSHREIARRWHHHALQKEFRVSAVLALVLFVASFAVNTYAINFATEHASNAVTDIVLSNVPAFDVDALFVYGTFLAALLTVLLCLAHPKRIPFVLYAATLFFITRALFVTLTHLGPFEPHTAVDFGVTVNRMFFGADLFFSGHTGLPFLGALVFWREPTIRWFYLITSVFFAVIVLLGHLHYTIDVVSAFFITYGIFHITERIFPKERALFYSEVPVEYL